MLPPNNYVKNILHFLGEAINESLTNTHPPYIFKDPEEIC